MKVIAVLRKSNSLVYVRVRDGRGKDVNVSTSMYIDPIYWDSKKITGYKNTKKVPKDKAEIVPFSKQYLLYVVKRLCHSWHFRKFIHILCVHCRQYSYAPCALSPTTTQG